MDLSNKYVEDYDDQDGAEFTHLSYVDLSGKTIVEEISGNLAARVAEIRRCNGKATAVQVYK